MAQRVLASSAALLFAISACARQEPATAAGSTHLALTLPAPSAQLGTAEIAAVTLTVTAPDINPLVIPLTKTEGSWQVTILLLPAGLHRKFSAVATAADGTPLYAGEADDQTISAGSDNDIQIVMMAVAAAPPWADSAPQINYVTASTNQVSANQQLTLVVNATDHNAVSDLSYLWSISPDDGSFSAPDSDSTLYIPDPENLGQHVITVTVTDAQMVSSAVQIPILVIGSNATAQIGVTLDLCSTVSRIEAQPASVSSGQTLSLTASLQNLEGTSLTLQWSVEAPCAGAFDQPGLASTQFTPNPLTSASCVFTLTLTDPLGCITTGSLTLPVVQGPPPVYTPPTIDTVTPSSGQVGDTVTIQGLSFATVSSLSFNGVSQPIYTVDATGTVITTTVPLGASSGPLVITNLAGTAQAEFTVLVPVAAVALTAGSEAPADGTTTTTLTASVTDASGAPISGQRVTFSASGGIFANGATATTNGLGQAAIGVASTTAQLGATASAGGVNSSPLSVSFTPVPSPSNSHISVSGSVPANGLAAATVTVSINDYANLPIADVSISLSITAGAGLLSAGSCTTGSDGTCAVQATSQTPGVNTITASAPVALSTTVQFTSIANAALSLTLSYPDLSNSTQAPPQVCLRAVVGLLADAFPTPAMNDLPVRLVQGGPLGSGAFYTDASCTQETRTVTIPAQSPSVTAYLRLIPTGAYTAHSLRAYASGYAPAFTSLTTSAPDGLVLALLPNLTYGVVINSLNPVGAQPPATPGVSLSLDTVNLPGGAITDYLAYTLNTGSNDGALAFAPASGLGSSAQSTSSNPDIAIESGLGSSVLTDVLEWTDGVSTPAVINSNVYPIGARPAVSEFAYSDQAGCANTSSGVRCWGKGIASTSYLATPITRAPAGAHALRLGSGSLVGDVACALGEDGTAACFGIDDSDASARVPTSGNPGATGVFPMQFFNCEATAEGLLWCQDDATSDDMLVPASVDCTMQDEASCEANPEVCTWFSYGCYKNEPSLTDLGAPVDDVITGDFGTFRTMVLAGGQVYTFGFNNNNGALQLGSNVPTPPSGVSQGYVSVPQKIPGISGATRIAFDNTSLCYVANGGLSCWHDSATGPMAAGAPLDSGIIAVAVTPTDHCALTATGTVYCFSFDGQHGGFSTIAPLASQPETIVALARADSGNAPGLCGLGASGMEYCWGSGSTSAQSVLGTIGLGSASLPLSANSYWTAPVTILAEHNCGAGAYWDGARCRCSLANMDYDPAEGICHPDCGANGSWDEADVACSCQPIGQAASATFDYDLGLCTYSCVPSLANNQDNDPGLYTWNEKTGVCGCTDSQRIYDSSQGCIYNCGPNGNYDPTSSVCDCNNLYTFSNSQGTCVLDPSQVCSSNPGAFWTGQTCQCSYDGQTIWDPVLLTCNSDPRYWSCTGSQGTWDPNQLTCACPGGQSWDGAECDCPDGQTYDPGSMTCQ